MQNDLALNPHQVTENMLRSLVNFAGYDSSGDTKANNIHKLMTTPEVVSHLELFTGRSPGVKVCSVNNKDQGVAAGNFIICVYEVGRLDRVS